MKGFVTKRDFVNEVQKRRKMGDIPPPFPNGWFGLLRSTELKAGQSTAVNALGQNFAVFRDDKGNAHVLDAYCAHLGANLGVGGKVCRLCAQVSLVPIQALLFLAVVNVYLYVEGSKKIMRQQRMKWAYS